MRPYMKSTTSQEELFKIIESLEILQMHYRITSNTQLINKEWVRCWDVDELGE